jgi:hypothetical protein
MRSFGQALSSARTAEITALIAELYALLPLRREVLGAEYMMEPADAVVIQVGELKVKNGPRLRIGATQPAVRPPFEWLYELTSDVTPADYFKHYLVLEDQIVLAHLKVLTPIDDAEGDLIMSDLLMAREVINEL